MSRQRKFLGSGPDYGETLLSIIIKYVNSKNSNDSFTKRELASFVKSYIGGYNIYSPNSINTYRNLLTTAGYICKVSNAKSYIKMKQIPETLNLLQLRKEAYPNK